MTLVNAPGTGIADDKSIYTYIPDVIEFYTGEKPLLKNVPTWRCAEPERSGYVLEHLAELVVKEVHGSGGYGMLVGPTSSKARRSRSSAPSSRRGRRTTSPSRRWRSRHSRPSPMPAWRRAMSICGPSCSSGDRIRITPGGLTRVALKEGSLVVNSSQGGGTKDTWVLED